MKWKPPPLFATYFVTEPPQQSELLWPYFWLISYLLNIFFFWSERRSEIKLSKMQDEAIPPWTEVNQRCTPKPQPPKSSYVEGAITLRNSAKIQVFKYIYIFYKIMHRQHFIYEFNWYIFLKCLQFITNKKLYYKKKKSYIGIG